MYWSDALVTDRNFTVIQRRDLSMAFENISKRYRRSRIWVKRVFQLRLLDMRTLS